MQDEFWDEIEKAAEEAYLNGKGLVLKTENEKSICDTCGHFWTPSQHDPDTCEICGVGSQIEMYSEEDWRRKGMKSVARMLVDEGLVISLSEGRRLIHQKAVSIDDKVIGDPGASIDNQEHVVKIGKKITKTTRGQTG